MIRNLTSIIFGVFIMLFSGCAYFNFTPGDKPSATSPKLVSPPGQKQFWNNAKLFGPVPAMYQDEGNKECAAQGDGKAIGYHPDPKDYYGKSMGKRGYLCAVF
ncbi:MULTISPECIES: hypothetical protein [Sodalis]|jgi:hypothetical protein|uniref:Lipoprotein n=1 Tax=Sodalis ligni TaxID=2697027 RepID=A0A4R1N7W4_9GAMM|nr:hypothetical protein [Sodalis ligni]TCL03283.1 hypothetical protein EZJ58_1344 [Sodalis ligni]